MRSLLASNRRFALVVVGIAACVIAVVVRLAWLQIVAPEKYVRDARAKTHSREVYSAHRGTITDFRGEVLAYNFERWDIGVDPAELADGDEALIPKIAELLEVPEADIREKYARKDRHWVVLKRDVTPEVRRALMELQPRRVVKDGQPISRVFKPVYGQAKFVRHYPKGELAAQLIGFVNKEGVPAMGIEAAMDGFLRGSDGWTEIMHDRRGRELVYRRSREVPARNGNTVELTIDARIQGFAEAECRRLAEKYSPNFSCIIVSEAGTGRLLALANWPTFNLNEFYDPAKAPPESQRNRAVTDIYDPGSVFKTVTVAMALQEKVVTPGTRFDCTKPTAIYGRSRKMKPLRLPSDTHDLGPAASVRDIVRESSNRGSAQIGMRFAERLGERAFYDYVLKFGFGSRTNLISVIGEKGESPGKVPAPEQWDSLTITRMPIGHSISVTPLQTHDAMSVIANRGKFLEPLLVGRVLDESGAQLVEYAPHSRGQVISPEVAGTVAEMLRAVCMPGGTARQADIPGYEVAGKTGTSQKYVNGRPSARNHVASFSGFFPARNPKVIITVVVDDPKGVVGYGGTVAAPVFREVAQEVIRQLEIKPVEETLPPAR